MVFHLYVSQGNLDSMEYQSINLTRFMERYGSVPYWENRPLQPNMSQKSPVYIIKLWFFEETF